MQIDGNTDTINTPADLVAEPRQEFLTNIRSTMDWTPQNEEDLSIEPGDDGEPSKEQVWSMPESEQKLPAGTMSQLSEDFEMGVTRSTGDFPGVINKLEGLVKYPICEEAESWKSVQLCQSHD